MRPGAYHPSLSPCATRYCLLPDVPGYASAQASCLQLLERCYASHEAGESFATLRQRLLTKLQAARKRLKNTVASLRSQLDACQAHEEVRKRADLLMANVYRSVDGFRLWCGTTWVLPSTTATVATTRGG